MSATNFYLDHWQQQKTIELAKKNSNKNTQKSNDYNFPM